MEKRIPPFRLKPEPLDEAAARLPQFKWAGPEVGRRHKLGGAPDFIQGEDWPVCSECPTGGRMTFYAQLDSINDEFVLADVGMIYVFVCYDCYAVAAVIQSS